MAQTILPKKAGFEQPMALDDEHHEQLAADPMINQFPQGSTFGSSYATTNSFSNSATFGSPSTGGFGSSGGFGSPASAPTGFGGGQPQQPQQNLTQAGSNAAQGADVLAHQMPLDHQ